GGPGVGGGPPGGGRARLAHRAGRRAGRRVRDRPAGAGAPGDPVGPGPRRPPGLGGGGPAVSERRPHGPREAGAMRFVIYGAGAIGGAIGGRLFEAGHDVTLIARGAHEQALRVHGLRLASPAGVATLSIPVVNHPAEADLRPGDVVVLAMKSHDTAAAVATLADCAPPDIAVVCAQNGVENERMALRWFPDVYAVNVVCPASHLEP